MWPGADRGEIWYREYQGRDPAETLAADLAYRLQNYPEGFASAPVREGLQTLIAPLNGRLEKGQISSNLIYDFLAAGTGDAVAFKELMQPYGRMPAPVSWANSQKAGGFESDSSATLADDDIAQDNSELVLNGNPIKEPKRVPQFAQCLLNTVRYLGMGDKKAGVLSHLDEATFDNGLWTISDPSFVAAHPQAASAGRGVTGGRAAVPGGG